MHIALYQQHRGINKQHEPPLCPLIVQLCIKHEKHGVYDSLARHHGMDRNSLKLPVRSCCQSATQSTSYQMSVHFQLIRTVTERQQAITFSYMTVYESAQPAARAR